MPPGTERTGPRKKAGPTNTLTQTIQRPGDSLAEAYRLGRDTLHWTAVEEWWTHPALAYLAGLHDGARLERDRIAAEDDQLHRVAVRSALDTISRADRWELAR